MSETTAAGAPPSGPPRPSVSVFLVNLGRRAREGVEARLHEHGLAYHHLSALGHLHRQPGLSYSELARRARVTVQSMQTTVARLQEQGLVAAGETTTRGRRADLHLTEQGVHVLHEAEASVRLVDDELLDGFAPPERAALEAALLRMFAETASGRMGSGRQRPEGTSA